jgi:predicted metal-dependent HD superfamily phosphohydrolase
VTTDRLRARWDRTLASLGISAEQGEPVLRELIKAYGGAGRYYHNLDHLEAVLATLDTLVGQARERPALELAAWFHDAVYDPRSADNEEASAALAESTSAAWGLSASFAGRVGRLIRATATHQAEDADSDTHLLLDADLAILGAEPVDYDRYAEAIRREYAWVHEEDYRRGRGRVLRQFLQRERIYQLEAVHAALDARARDNLRRELGRLGEL